ncbi:hypothetical protein [Tropicimonas aquimaris]|uniref:Tripartite tricarboxylate transporter TctB family protein n=1 Tax=Tropicimonas aquimaris TaxID=914152 RepID=A0ABW3IP86_9RHOB
MRLSGHLAFILLMMAATFGFFVLSTSLPVETRRAPMIVVIPTFVLLAWELLRELRAEESIRIRLSNPGALAWLLGFVAVCQAIDGVVAIPVFLLLAFRYWARANWTVSLGAAVGVFVLLRISFPSGLAHPPLF